jgi:hypothetical protein
VPAADPIAKVRPHRVVTTIDIRTGLAWMGLPCEVLLQVLGGETPVREGTADLAHNRTFSSAHRQS